MKKLNVYLSGHVRTLYECFPKTLETIRKTNPDVKIRIFYSFWDSKDRMLNRAIVRNSPDLHWARKLEDYDLSDKMVQKENLDRFFTENGCEVGVGQIVDTQIMDKVISDSPFVKESQISSQYYQMKEALMLHPKPEEESYCMRVRADIEIHQCPALNTINDSLMINQFVWEGLTYQGNICNEMVWVSKGKYFPKTCEVYDIQDNYVDCVFGEKVTGRYFLDLIDSGALKHLSIFDFQYRVVR